MKFLLACLFLSVVLNIFLAFTVGILQGGKQEIQRLVKMMMDEARKPFDKNIH